VATLSFLPTPNVPIVVIHAESQQMADDVHAAHERAVLSRPLGGLQVVMRCRPGDHVSVSGDEHLRVHAISREVDTLPRLTIVPAPTLAPLPCASSVTIRPVRSPVRRSSSPPTSPASSSSG
jgi:hypothetical protein